MQLPTSERAAEIARAYGGDREMPLGGYVVLAGTFALGFAGLLALSRRRAPERVPAGDVALLGVATHVLTRIVTKDWVTAPLRAPFTTYVESTGGGEVKERSRGEGLQRATGDLLTCPWCSGPWVASALYAAYVLSPRLTRLGAAVFASVAVSNHLHFVYGATRALPERVERRA